MKKINKSEVLKQILENYPETKVIPAEAAYQKSDLLNDLIRTGLDDRPAFTNLATLEIAENVAGSKMLGHCLSQIADPQPYTVENTVPWMELVLNYEVDKSYLIFTEAAVTICNMARENRILDDMIRIYSGRSGIDHFVMYPVRLAIFFATAEKYEIKELLNNCRKGCGNPSLQTAFESVLAERESSYLSPNEFDRLERAVFDDEYFRKIIFDKN